MKPHDLGHELTEKEFGKLEKRIASVYSEARAGLTKTVEDYFAAFEKRDEDMKKRLDSGDITEDYYKQWRLAQIGRGKRFQALRDEMAERYTNANEVALSYVNDSTPGIYSLNRNYSAYTIEQVAGDVGFTLFDEQTVKRLIAEKPDTMPHYPPKRALKRGIDLDYGKKQITASVTSSILQGKSIKKMADDLQERIEIMNRASAIRAARTATTGAQNAGRVDGYAAAEKMGIKLKKEWLATLDGRTRHSHAMLDGEKVANDAKFSNGCRFPGDPQGPAQEVYNCRCTLIAALEDVDTSDAKRHARDPETGESVLIDDMTYAEWVGWKQKASPETKPDKTEPVLVVQGKNLIGEIDYTNSEFDYDVETAIHAQGFDGEPQILPQSEFDEAVKKANFYAERTYSAESKELLDAYRKQLYNGKWYVDCTDGGAQYGKGMYCASSYGLERWQIDGIKEEMEHYQGLGILKGRLFHYTEGITLQPDAKIFTLYSDTADIANRYVKEYALKNAKSEEAKSLIRELISLQDDIDRNSNTNFVDRVDWDFIDSLYEKRNQLYANPIYQDEIKHLMNQGVNLTINRDAGALAAEMGYDAINAQGHGKSDSYTVILNRTKCILLEGGIND